MDAGFVRMGEGLRRAGVDTVFGVMGEGNLEFVHHWVHGLGGRYIAARHENGAVAMATGYAWTSQRIGVCTATHGPGVTNSLTALTTAGRARVPVVFLAGALPEFADPANPQWIGQEELCRATGVAFFGLVSPRGALGVWNRALQHVLTTGCPAVVNAPTDVQGAPWGSESEPTPDMRVAEAEPPLADAATLDDVATLLANSRSPIILGGRGAYLAGAAPVLEELAEHLGALLISSLLAKGLFADHPLDLGVSGGFSRPAVATLLREGDVVLAFGASLNHWTTQNGNLFSDATIVQCDLRREAIGAYGRVDVGVVGDARSVASELLELLRKRLPSQEQRRVSREAAVAARRAETLKGRRSPHSHAVATMVALDDALAKERTVVVDGGHFMGYPTMELDVPDPRGFVWTSTFGSIGLGLGAGAGAYLGRPSHKTVVVVGDGGVTMSLGELETIARCRLPIVVVVMNDAAYGAEVNFMSARGLSVETALFPTLDFAALAEALGMLAVTVEASEADIRRMCELLRETQGPILVDVRLDHGEMAPWFREHLDRQEEGDDATPHLSERAQ